MMNGLHIKNGRLINDRPDGETGIQQAARIKNQKKIDMIADGIGRAEMREKLRDMMF